MLSEGVVCVRVCVCSCTVQRGKHTMTDSGKCEGIRAGVKCVRRKAASNSNYRKDKSQKASHGLSEIITIITKNTYKGTPNRR